MVFGCLNVGCFLVILPLFFFLLFARMCTLVLVASRPRLASEVTVELQHTKCVRPQTFKVRFLSTSYTQTSPRWIPSAFVLLVSKNCSLVSQAELLASLPHWSHASKKITQRGMASYICWVLHRWSGSWRSPCLSDWRTPRGRVCSVGRTVHKLSFRVCVGV